MNDWALTEYILNNIPVLESSCSSRQVRGRYVWAIEPKAGMVAPRASKARRQMNADGYIGNIVSHRAASDFARFAPPLTCSLEDHRQWRSKELTSCSDASPGKCFVIRHRRHSGKRAPSVRPVSGVAGCQGPASPPDPTAITLILFKSCLIFSLLRKSMRSIHGERGLPFVDRSSSTSSNRRGPSTDRQISNCACGTLFSP